MKIHHFQMCSCFLSGFVLMAILHSNHQPVFVSYLLIWLGKPPVTYGFISHTSTGLLELGTNCRSYLIILLKKPHGFP